VGRGGEGGKEREREGGGGDSGPFSLTKREEKIFYAN